MTIYFLVCFLLLILFGVAYYAYRICFYSSNTGRDTLPIVSGIPYEPYRDIIDKMLPALISRPSPYTTKTLQKRRVSAFYLLFSAASSIRTEASPSMQIDLKLTNDLKRHEA